MSDKSPKKESDKDKKNGVDPKEIVLDDAGRFEVKDEELGKVSGGMRGSICRIQTDPRGCSMDM